MTSTLISEPTERTALADLRANAMNLPAEQMQTALAEYTIRRDAFRDWLLKQLTEGVHYGYVPGTEPKFDNAGNMITKSWDKRNNAYKETIVSPKSWQAKRTLYKAGAEFIVDLMGVRAEYAADVEAWQQLGAVAGNFVFKCKLVSRATGEHVGEGIGARKVGTKGGDENNAVKMAQKSALVAAVLNSYGLSDLFTQDIEDDSAPPPRKDNPQRDANAPQTGTRAERAAAGDREEQLAALSQTWRESQRDVSSDTNIACRQFYAWAQRIVGRDKFNPAKLADWTDEDVRKCEGALR